MNNLKRITALIMSVVMVLTLFGCGQKGVAPETTTVPADQSVNADEISYVLPYLRTASLNPFNTDSETNLNLATLLFDSLFSVDKTFKAEPLMAESYTQNGTKINVKLKKLFFTDGSVVTASDVVESFVKAKKSNNYRTFLENISDCSTVNDSEVVFTLKDKNAYEVSNLFFPIIKKGSEKDDGDTVEGAPIGSGRYTFINENGNRYLLYNKDRLGGYEPKYHMVGLKDTGETASMSTLFAVRNLDVHAENYSEGVYVDYQGTTFNKELTHFTFLGINCEDKRLSDPRVRRAISLLLDREDIVSASFSGIATPTTTPFSPFFYGTKNCTLPSMKPDVDAAIKLLEEAGYDKFNPYGTRRKDGAELSFTIIVNEGNSFRVAVANNVSKALAEADIYSEVRPISYSKYIDHVENGGYTLYIGEVKLPYSFDLSHFFNGEQDISQGIDQNCPTAQKYKAFENGTASIQSFIDTYADDLPFVALAFRHGVAVRSDKIKTDLKPIVSDYFYNIDEWAV